MLNNKIIQSIKIITLAGVISLLAGCIATSSVLTKSSLDVQNQMSNSIFLQPVPDTQKTIYIAVHNTSDQPTMSGLAPALKQDLTADGYKIVTNPNAAHYILQVNILRAGKQEPGGTQTIVDGAVGGGAVGALAGLAGGSGTTTAIGAASGVAAGVVLDALVHNVTYTVLTNIQIQERSAYPLQAAQTSVVQQGSNSTTTLTSNQVSGWNVYRTRMVSTAQRVNLSFAKASPAMIESMAQSIAGIF